MIVKTRWLAYIPEDGHWDVYNYSGNNERKARKAFLQMLQSVGINHKRLPTGTKVFRI